MALRIQYFSAERPKTGSMSYAPVANQARGLGSVDAALQAASMSEIVKSGTNGSVAYHKVKGERDNAQYKGYAEGLVGFPDARQRPKELTRSTQCLSRKSSDHVRIFLEPNFEKTLTVLEKHAGNRRLWGTRTSRERSQL